MAAACKADTAGIYTDIEAMYEKTEMDAVFICLPPFAHTLDVDIAAEKGIHIFIEKPIAGDMATAQRMVRKVEAAGVKSQVGFMLRFGDAVEQVKAKIDSGEAGWMAARYMCNCLHSDWWRDKSKSGGQVVEQVIHIYDLTRYLLGEPDTVACFMNNHSCPKQESRQDAKTARTMC